MIGTTISHYKILEKLGEGGMGVVYKARDTKLDRDVALKFLPRDVSMSEEERSRFIHEAKAASALEHPNICTIHHVEETPDGQMYIVMGYYDGNSISKIVEKGRLDVDQAVSIAIQIAEGLQAAHEKGIVHRDIKSSNVIVSDKGQVKILDFGLAKRKGLSKLTKTGTTIGTASYMSPEQAQGESVDYRTDIWSLGVVLYEMVTGRLPFRGEHEAAILYSVVNEQPKPIEESVAEASHELIHIINRALEKESAERYKSAEDMLIDLRRLKKETSRTGFRSVGTTGRKSIRKRNKIFIGAGATILLGAALVAFFFLSKRSSGINPDWKSHPFQIPLTNICYPGMSRDGVWIAFGARDPKGNPGLYIMNTIHGGPRLVTNKNSQDVWVVDVSADGSLLGYFQYKEKIELYTVYSNGGTPQRIVEEGGVGIRFRPDEKRIGYVRGWPSGYPSPSGKLEFWSVGIDGTDPHREFIDSVSSIKGALSFAYSPDGKKIAWLRSFPEMYVEIIIHDLETGQEKTITSDRKLINEVLWVRENQIVYTTNKSGIMNIWVVSAEGGTPIQITKGTDPITAIKGSADGQKIVYLQEMSFSDFYIVNIAENRPRKITFTEENQYSPRMSPDGKEIAFISGGPGDEVSYGRGFYPSHLYVMDRDGSNRRQLTFGDEVVWGLTWSPDGRRIAYGSRNLTEPVDSLRTYLIEPSNPGSPKYITRGEARYWLDSTRFQVKLNDKFYVTSVDAAPPVEVYDDSTVALITPGGKYLLYQDHRQGKDRKVWWITDATKPRDVQRKIARILPWHIPDIKFSGDGKTAYAVGDVGEIWRIELPDGKEERIPANFLGVDNYYYFSPSWDGKEIIIVKSRQESKIVMIENLFK
jgi:serine/threonine protein kinase